jgi:Bacterial regulatory protein, Fis family
MVGVEQYDPNVIIQVIHECKGLITHAARRLGCSPTTVDRYARTYEQVQQAIDEERRALVDLAELSLMKALQEREPWAIQLVLRTIGKDRGYVERKDVNGSIDVQLTAPRLREVVIQLPQLPDSESVDTMLREEAPTPLPGAIIDVQATTVE